MLDINLRKYEIHDLFYKIILTNYYMDYKDKYIKYKNKYIKLKSQIAGAFSFEFDNDEPISILVNAYPFESENGGAISILAYLSGNTLDRVNERRIKLGLSEIKTLHITLLQLHINFSHPDSVIFSSQEFFDAIEKSYLKNLTTVFLNSPLGNWNFFGRAENKYWVRVYTFNDKFKHNITQFRLDIYDYLNKNLEKLRKESIVKGNAYDNTEYVFVSNDSGQLYAIDKQYYYGVENWKPHISVFNFKELNKGSELYKYIINDENTKEDKILEIRTKIGNDVQAISNIEFNRDINKLLIAIRYPKGLKKDNIIEIKK
jgi:hypothetical protein